jgi:hypothetical protein
MWIIISFFERAIYWSIWWGMISIGLAMRAGWYLEGVVKVANFTKTV